ncbi:hypothetical protein PCANB_002226 [Pneumocystis canis]|nr:hypothetical protein PCK1_002349 [Pneumocystis canis]KAG5438896.1 hypothetical protein PCANB_002226 [Pneumocystis canis]
MVEEETLSQEFAVLSSKLVASIEKQASLEDRMHWTDHALAAAKIRIRELEAAQQECVERMAQVLQEKQGIEEETKALMTKLIEETRQRGQAETDKRTIEKELEDLTKTLFEEANRMVSVAYKEREYLEKRNEHLQAKLEDTEMLLRSHQTQLAELKERLLCFSNMSINRNNTLVCTLDTVGIDETINTTDTTINTIPLTPQAIRENSLSLNNNDHGTLEELPRQFRNDIPAFHEFSVFFHTICAQKKTSPVSSFEQSVSSTQPDSPVFHNLNRSSTGPIRSSSPFFHLTTPTLFASFKESKFIKRCIYEDIEPTLRLDNAPGLSWLARRTMFSAILDGQLVIEPAKSLNTSSSCSLCGNDCCVDKDMQIHQFRTSESQNTLKSYPMCSYCLRRVRSVCNFAGFIRQLRDGLWKMEDNNDEIKAWKETIRLREAMFWSRVGAYFHTDSMLNKNTSS